uniref:Uncharacterized protein n=1 Tax=Physcomitrium patens TaxID=3218 RepID=A0A7I4AU71_PHYPA
MNGRRQHARRMRRKNGGDGVFSTLLHQRMVSTVMDGCNICCVLGGELTSDPLRPLVSIRFKHSGSQATTASVKSWQVSSISNHVSGAQICSAACGRVQLEEVLE